MEHDLRLVLVPLMVLDNFYLFLVLVLNRRFFERRFFLGMSFLLINFGLEPCKLFRNLLLIILSDFVLLFLCERRLTQTAKKIFSAQNLH